MYELSKNYYTQSVVKFFIKLRNRFNNIFVQNLYITYLYQNMDNIIYLCFIYSVVYHIKLYRNARMYNWHKSRGRRRCSSTVRCTCRAPLASVLYTQVAGQPRCRKTQPLDSTVTARRWLQQLSSRSGSSASRTNEVVTRVKKFAVQLIIVVQLAKKSLVKYLDRYNVIQYKTIRVKAFKYII